MEEASIFPSHPVFPFRLPFAYSAFLAAATKVLVCASHFW